MGKTAPSVSCRRRSSSFAPQQNWKSLNFALENAAKGTIQAIASLAVYAFAIWLIIKNRGHDGILSSALGTKAPVLMRSSGTPPA